LLGFTRKDASLNYIEKTGINVLQQYSFGSGTTIASLNTNSENAVSAQSSKKISRIQLSPVPATNATTLTVYAEEAFKSNLKLYGIDGKLYQQKAISIEAGTNQFVVDVSRLISGTYYVQIDLQDGRKQTLRLIKQ
jgi:hypothetical protein